VTIGAPFPTLSTPTATSYLEATAELFALQGRGVKLGLDNIRALLEALDSPHRHYRVIQVAGTNGKGSTASFLAAGLQAAGLRVGLFTSPHLVDFRERIRIDDVPISEREVVQSWETIRPEIDRRNMTFFEANTAIALSHFADRRCDIAVLETGLGGRLDSTTAAQATVCLLTKIAFDHREYLGHTLGQIAAEKAAILRNGTRALSMPQDPEAAAVFRTIASRVGAELTFVEEPRDVWITPSGTEFFWRGERVWLRMVGRHQAQNALLALETLCDILPELVQTIPPMARLAQAIGSVEVPGRYHIVRGAAGPLVLDVAHNPDALLRFAEAMGDAYPASESRVFIAMLRDKDLEGSVAAVRSARSLVEPILMGSAASAPEGRRLRKEDWLALPASVRDAGVWVGGVSEGLAALEGWQREAPGRVTALVGSFTTVGEAMRQLGIGVL
jgi:dihydrofolate synthase/folylpolyglutamate synthase